MNAEAEKFADDLTLWGCFYEAGDGDYDGCANTSEIRDAIIQGMRFAYADAAKVCREFSTVEGIAQKCAEAIEGRAR